MIQLLIQKNYITSNKYLKMIDNIIHRNIIRVIYFNDISSINSSHSANIVLCDSLLLIENSCSNLISAIKKILSLLDTLNKLIFLKDIFQDIPVIIFSCGPSGKTNFDVIQSLQNEYVIVCIKYMREILIENMIDIDLMITSDYSHQGFDNVNPNERNTISLHMLGNMNPIKKDIYFRPFSKHNHESIFNLVTTKNQIDLLKINIGNISNNIVYVNLAHIMLEIAVPFLVFMGATDIYTFGWDGLDSDQQYRYFNQDKNQVIKQLHRSTETEYMYIPKIAKLFKSQGINIYKCSKKSPIKLIYKPLV